MPKDLKPEIKLFLLVALIAVVISVGGILLLRTVESTPAPAPQPQMPEAVHFTLSGVEGWQTYRNDEFGFEVKYPNEWEIGEKSYSNLPRSLGADISLAYTGPSALRLLKSVSFNNKSINSPVMLEVRVDVVQYFKEYPLSGYLPPEYALPLSDDYEDSKYTIADREITIRKKFLDQDSFTLGTSPIVRSDLYFYLIGKSSELGQSRENLLLQILSTFRFVE